MPRYKITGEDGNAYYVTAPDGATPEQVMSNFKLAQPKLKPMDPGLGVMAVNPDVTDGMSTYDKVAAGTGMAFSRLGRGIGQLIGVSSPEDELAARKRDASLADTGAGKIGDFIGTAAPFATTALIPGANTYTGAALLGAGAGAVQPVAPGESRMANIGLGIGGGIVGQLGGNAVINTARALKAAAEPLYQKGQDAILGRLLNKTAGGGQFAADAQANLANPQQFVPGSMPTVGQAAGSPGIAALERTATATQPEVVAQMAQRMAAQNEARTAALAEIADPAKRDFFNQARNAAAKDLYATAFAEVPDATPWLKGQFSQLRMRPAFKDAVLDAQTQAANEGVKLDTKNQTQIAHYAKMSLDDAINKAKAAGSDASGLISTRDKLVSVMESKDFAPSYRVARDTYKQMSQPINEADTAAAIQQASARPLDGQIMPNAFAKALSDRTAQRATGYSGATLENTMSPEALASLNGIKADLARSVAAQNSGRGPGSDTIQKLAYSNMIDQAGIPTWLRNFAPTEMAGNLALKGGNVIYGKASETMANRLAHTMLSPEEAARIMALPQAQQNEAIKSLMSNIGRTGGLLAPSMAAPSGLLAYPQQ